MGKGMQFWVKGAPLVVFVILGHLGIARVLHVSRGAPPSPRPAPAPFRPAVFVCAQRGQSLVLDPRGSRTTPSGRRRCRTGTSSGTDRG